MGVGQGLVQPGLGRVGGGGFEMNDGTGDGVTGFGAVDAGADVVGGSNGAGEGGAVDGGTKHTDDDVRAVAEYVDYYYRSLGGSGGGGGGGDGVLMQTQRQNIREAINPSEHDGGGYDRRVAPHGTSSTGRARSEDLTFSDDWTAKLLSAAAGGVVTGVAVTLPVAG